MADKERLAYLRAIKSYITLLSRLTGQAVREEQLCSLDETRKLKDQAAGMSPVNKKTFEVSPAELRSDRFTHFVQRLHKANSSPIYIWVDATNQCGALQIPGITAFNFLFDFSNVPGGTVVLLAVNLEDRLLLDIDSDTIELETQGNSWPKVIY